MNSEENDLEYRKKRIKRMKKMIITIAVVMIIIPTVLCIILFFRMSKLQSTLDKILEGRRDTIVSSNDKAVQKGQVDGSINIDIEATVSTESETDKKDAYVEEKTTESSNISDSQENALKVENTDLNVTAENDKINEKKVYLTFDDGPSVNTDRILDILSQFGVKATFFVIAYDDEPSIARYQRIINEGHTLAMHSTSHRYDLIYSSMENYIDDVFGLQNFLLAKTGYKPVVYRFPGGSSNTVTKIEIAECASYLKKNGITYFDWNVASGDASSTKHSTEEIYNNVISGIESVANEAVVLMHDSNTKDTTADALPQILTKLKEMGVKVLPITSETVPVQHRVYE